ncbi:MAG: nucleoside monophosphate kinase [Actinomycetota bacterium]|nr:nucleoside monophosphate kinase [Actinomycetota bacterium]
MTEGERAVRLLLIGPPGSGKGTQGKRVAQRYGVEHIAAGDLLRLEVETESGIGRRAAASMQRGELVPDALVYELVMPRVLAAGKANGYVLDGFPRSVGQAEEGRAIFEDNDVAVCGWLYYSTPSRMTCCPDCSSERRARAASTTLLR